MGIFLKVVGVVSAILIVAWLAITLTSQGANYVLIWLPWAIPAVVSSIVLAAFGTIVTDVQDMRRAADRQNELLLAIRDKLTR